MGTSMGTRLYMLSGGDGDEIKVRYPLHLGMGMMMNFFLQGWVWDSETRLRPALLPSLFRGLEVSAMGRRNLQVMTLDGH